MNGIHCIETCWEGENPVSVKEPLCFLAKYHGAPFEHRMATDPDSFGKYLEEWDQGDYNHAILYLGFHGFAAGLDTRNQRKREPKSLSDYVRLDQLADYANGTWKHCVVHMASCSTLAVEGGDLGDFLERTKLEAVTGYATDVDWIESLAFDLVFLDTLLGGVGNKWIKSDQLRICRDKLMQSNSWGLGGSLGFRFHIRDDYHG